MWYNDEGSYEDRIVYDRDSEIADDCATCEYKGVDTCKNQCMAEYYAWLDRYENSKN